MADEKKVVIELKVSGSGDATSEEEQQEEDKEEYERKSKRKTILSLGKQIASWGVSEIVAQANYDIGKYISLTEDYKASVSLSNVMTTINKVKGMASKIISTAQLGASVGGGWGAAAGAIIGAAESTVSTILDLKRQYTNQDLQLKMVDNQTYYAQSRLGLIDGGRGTQN